MRKAALGMLIGTEHIFPGPADPALKRILTHGTVFHQAIGTALGNTRIGVEEALYRPGREMIAERFFDQFDLIMDPVQGVIIGQADMAVDMQILTVLLYAHIVHIDPGRPPVFRQDGSHFIDHLHVRLIHQPRYGVP